MAARRRAEAEADAAPRRRRSPRGIAAEVSAGGGRLLSAQAARRLCLYRDAGRRHQSAGAIGRAFFSGQGAARQAEVDRRQFGAPDLRPSRPAAVRRPRLRLRLGSRRRRPHPALAGAVRPDSGGHARPRTPQGQEGAQEEETVPARRRGVLERVAVPGLAVRRGGQTLQQRPDTVAAAGVSAEGIAGDRQGPQRSSQAPDG